MISTAEFRLEVQKTIRVAFLGRLEKYLALVDESQDPDDHRKSVELLSKLADAFPDKETSKSLPVVHINFGAGAVSFTPQAPEPVETIDLLEGDDPLKPTLRMRAHLGVNLDVEPLLLEEAAC